MALTITFNQFGLPPGSTDQGRTDIISTDGPAVGEVYPVEITVAGIPPLATIELVLLDEPPGASPVLTQVTPELWTLAFARDCWGPFRVRCNAVVNGAIVDTVTRRISIRSPGYAMAYPALAERYDPNATFVATVPSIDVTEMNEGSTNRPLVNFYRELCETLEAIGTGSIGTIPDGAISEAKLDPAFVAELVLIDGSHVMTAPLDLGTQRIINLAAPTAPTDAARLQDVTAAIYVPGTGLRATGTTLDVVANDDGSIIANANDIQVGVLATDAQHGDRGGGALHAAATTTVGGFQSPGDKLKLDGIAPGADPTIATLAANTAVLSVNNQRIRNVATPVANNDAATKQYVDTAPPIPHAATHADGAADELNVAGLSGLLADPQVAGSLKTATGTVSVSAAAAPVAGQVLAATSGIAAEWTTPTQLAAVAPTQITVTTAAVGVGTTAARADHVHSVSTGTPAALSAGATAADGTATALARSDHQHGVPVAAPSSLTVGGSNAGGSSTSLARADHVHALPAYGSAANTITQGNDARLSDDRTASGLRTATTVVAVSSATAPTPGQVLTATGSGAATWQTPLALTSSAPATVGTTNTVGVATAAARADHVHAHGAQTDGTLHALATTSVAGFFSATDKTKIDGIEAGAQVVTFSRVQTALAAASGAVSFNTQRLTLVADPTVSTDAATRGYVDAATTDGYYKLPVRTVARTAITLSGTQTVNGIALTVGDRVLCIAQASAPTNGIYVVASGAWSRATDADTSAKLKSGTLVYVSEASAGSGQDTLYALVTNDPITLGTTGLGFSPVGMTPDTANPQTITATAIATPGSLFYVSRSDHQHAITTAAPSSLAVGGTNSAGSGAALARADHVHALPSLVTTSVDGFMAATDKVRLDSMATGAAALTSSAPATVGTTNTVGVGTTAARSDHVHAHGAQTDGTLHATATTSTAGFLSAADKTRLDSMATGAAALTSSAPATVGTTNTVGVGTTAARSDHVHAHGAQTDGTLHAAATTGTAGFLSAADKTAYDSLNLRWTAQVKWVEFQANRTLSGVIAGAAAGERILIAAQTTASQNGIYVLAAGAWSRATEMDASAELAQGMTVQVTKGDYALAALGTNDYAGAQFVLTTAGPYTIGTTALNFKLVNLLGGITATAPLFVDYDDTPELDLLIEPGGQLYVNGSSQLALGPHPPLKRRTSGATQPNEWVLSSDYMPSTITFPASPADGDVFGILDYSEGDPTIAPASGQSVRTIAGATVANPATTTLTQDDWYAWIWMSSASTWMPYQTHKTLNPSAVQTAIVANGDLNLGNNQIFNLGAPSSGDEATNRTYVDAVNPGLNGFRLAPTTDDSVPADGTFTDVYLAAVSGNRIALYYSSAWRVCIVASTLNYTLSGRTAGTPFDVFAYWNGSAVALEVLNWSSATARATALAKQDGVWTKSGDATRRYLGTVRPRSATTYQVRRDSSDGSGTNPGPAGIDYWNADNRRMASVMIRGASGSWTWNTASYRQANASTQCQIDTIAGLELDGMHVHLIGSASCDNATGTLQAALAIGYDSTTTPTGARTIASLFSSLGTIELTSSHALTQPLGVHKLVWLERGTGTGNTQFNGNVSTPTHSGMTAILWH